MEDSVRNGDGAAMLPRGPNTSNALGTGGLSMKQKYAYRVVMALKSLTGDQFEQEMNHYAVNGWEWVGVIEHGAPSTFGEESGYVHLVFRREV